MQSHVSLCIFLGGSLRFSPLSVSLERFVSLPISAGNVRTSGLKLRSSAWRVVNEQIHRGTVWNMLKLRFRLRMAVAMALGGKLVS